jgi:hypothetical protein
VSTETILKKSPTLPDFLQPVFQCIDKKDFGALDAFFAEDFRLYFAHYSLRGIKQGIGFVGAFDQRLPKYEHVMGDIYVGEHLTYFDGTLRVWLPDDSVIETPFWDKIEVDPSSGTPRRGDSRRRPRLRSRHSQRPGDGPGDPV